MKEITHEAVAAKFAAYDLSENKNVSSSVLRQFLRQAYRGGDFSELLFQDLWNHSRPVGDEVSLKAYIKSVVEAEEHLLQNISKQKQNMVRLVQAERQNKSLRNVASDAEKRKLDVTLTNLQEERFKSEKILEVAHSELDQLRNTFRGKGESEAQCDVGLTLWLLSLCLLLDLFSSFIRPDFLGLLFYCFSIGLYLCNHYESKKIIFAAVLGFLSLAYDITWLATRMNLWWAPPLESSLTGMLPSLQKYCVVMCFILLIPKLTCACLLIKNRNLQTPCKVALGWQKSLLLSGPGVTAERWPQYLQGEQLR